MCLCCKLRQINWLLWTEPKSNAIGFYVFIRLYANKLPADSVTYSSLLMKFVVQLVLKYSPSQECLLTADLAHLTDAVSDGVRNLVAPQRLTPVFTLWTVCTQCILVSQWTNGSYHDYGTLNHALLLSWCLKVAGAPWTEVLCWLSAVYFSAVDVTCLHSVLTTEAGWQLPLGAKLHIALDYIFSPITSSTSLYGTK